MSSKVIYILVTGMLKMLYNLIYERIEIYIYLETICTNYTFCFSTLWKKKQNYAFFIFGILILVNFTNLSSFNTNINDKGYIFNPNQRFSKACGEQHFSSVFFVAFLLVLIWFGN